MAYERIGVVLTVVSIAIFAAWLGLSYVQNPPPLPLYSTSTPSE